MARMQTLKPGGKLGLVLHPRTDPAPVAEKLIGWARSHGKQVIADARDAARLPADVVPVSSRTSRPSRSTPTRAASPATSGRRCET